MASQASARFVPLEFSLDKFIDKQANKNTLSKTNRDVALLKEFLRMKEIDKEMEKWGAKQLDEVLCAFIVSVKKKDGGEYEPTTLRSFISSFDRYLRKKGYPTTGANIQGGTFNISMNTVSQQSPNLSLHSTKRRHYMIESDSN